MSFAIVLATDLVVVEAGSTATLSVEIANRGDQADTFELSVEGVDPGWTAVPVPTFQVDAHEVHSEKLFFKPPRQSESLAGTYPVVVNVRSLTDGESRTEQAVLEIKPFHHISVDVSPRKGVVKVLARQAHFDVTVMNLGNSDHSVQLFATDTEDACAFEFESDKLTLAPGQQKTVALSASGSRRALLANSRLYGFAVSARSTSVPTVVGSAQAQIEQRALITPGTFILVAMMAALVLGWIAMMPRDPTLDLFALDPYEAKVGDTVKVNWVASSDTKSVSISVDGELVQESPEARGSYEFIPTEAKVYEFTAVARNGPRTSRTITKMLTVGEPPPTPEPKILEFRIVPSSANVGDKLVVRYKLNPAVVKATLSPLGLVLDPKIGELEIEASREGDIEYRLVAENAKGATVEKTQRVKVATAPKAKVVVFRAEPKTLTSLDERIRLSWQLVDAVRAEVSYAGESLVVDPSEGMLDVSIQGTTKFTLTAYDSDGRTVTRELTVEVKIPPPPDQPGTPDSGTGSGENR